MLLHVGENTKAVNERESVPPGLERKTEPSRVLFPYTRQWTRAESSFVWNRGCCQTNTDQLRFPRPPRAWVSGAQAKVPIAVLSLCELGRFIRRGLPTVSPNVHQ